MAFYGPSTPLKACQGPAHTTHRFSISHQALTLPPPHTSLHHHHQSLHAYWLYGVCLLWLYGGISDVLKELFDDWDNDASWSELSQRFIANGHTHTQAHTHAHTHTREKTRPGCCKTSSTSSPGCFCLRFSCHSKPFSPPHVTQNYTAHAGLSPRGRSSPCLPCRTAFSCPSIMSAGDIQA